MDGLSGKLYLICAFFLAGTSVISARFVTGKLGTFTITAVSLFFVLVFLVPLSGKQLVGYLRLMSVRNFLFLSLQALCGIFLFRMFLLWGLHYTGSGEAGILTGATPAITALLAMMVLREAVSGRKLARILCTCRKHSNYSRSINAGKGLILRTHRRESARTLCGSL